MKKCQILVLFDQEGCIGVTANNTSTINSALYLKQCMATIRFLKTFYHNPNIYICDCHCDGQTLPRLSSLFTDIVFTSMPWNIDFSTAYSFALLIGFHGMQGTNDPLAHTFRPEIKQLKINNKAVGELTSFFYLLSKHNIPTLFFSGTEFIKEEYQKNIYPHATESIIHFTYTSSHIPLSQEYSNYYYALSNTVFFNPRRYNDLSATLNISISYKRKDMAKYLTQYGYPITFNDISVFINSFKDSAYIYNKYQYVFQKNLSYIRSIYMNGFSQPLPMRCQRIVKKRFYDLTLKDLELLTNELKRNDKK